MLPSGLSMLWEPVDPASALRERFGFTDPSHLASWLFDLVGGTWALPVTAVERVVISHVNVLAWVTSARGPLVVKACRAPDRFAALDASAGLLRGLAERGLPVAVPVLARDGRRRVVRAAPLGPLSVVLLPELAGDWLDVTDERSVRAAGACLAHLHLALAECPNGPWRTDVEPQPLRTQVERWLAVDDPGLAPGASRQLTERLTVLPSPDDPAQLVHHDYRAANVLTRGAVVTAVLDFDEMRLGSPLLDLAHAAVYLGTRFTDWRPTPAAAQAWLRAGYASVRPLGPLEDRWLDVLVRWRGLQAVRAQGDPDGWAQVG